LRMPPEGPPLSPTEVQALRDWIAAGAASPTGEKPEPDPRDHWAFRVPVRPPLPVPNEEGWSLNPIDAFIAAQREDRGLRHRPPADKGTLLRRVSLDLVGLPPTRDELRAFLADESPDAYEKVVDRLLQSPRYGERWGRHFMDVWRYSDWYGRRMVPDVWNSAPQIWRWRDWIVRSFNEDKGYDRMIAEMLAGDEVAPADDENVVATGFLVRNWYALNPNQWMRDVVEHTAKAFLGLTFNCAHCHDHKYDPIRQTDYFALRAFFEPIGPRQDRCPGEPDPGPFQEYEYSVLRKIVRLGSIRVYDKTPDAPTWFYTGGDERNRDTARGPIAPGVPAFLAEGFPKIQPVALPRDAYEPGLRPAIVAEDRARLREAVTRAEVDRFRALDESAVALPIWKARRDRAFEEYAVAAAAAEEAGTAVALEGGLSLRMDASRGRRIVNNALVGLKPLVEGASLRFKLQIQSDTHVNVQLAADATQGATAGLVAFEKGAIRSYRPGGTVEFEAGRYDVTVGQTSFDVLLTFEPRSDRASLTVTSLTDHKTLVEATPVAINGWNPASRPGQALTLDARTGSVVAFDAIVIKNGRDPDSETLTFDFESPRYEPGADVVGVDGWSNSPFGKAPATSTVTVLSASGAVREAFDRLARTTRAIAWRDLARRAGEARLVASQSERQAMEARLAADLARRGGSAEDLAQAAGELERLSARETAEAAVLEARRLALGPDTDPRKATTAVEEAEKALEKAVAALKASPKAPAHSPVGPVYPATSTGRRKALAAWITAPENPLAARVAVNHLWMRHFHSPLVGTVFDFGRNGANPTHPALLDWLAVELRESGWSFKRLHRLIVTSQTYRMSSSRGDLASEAGTDPENAHFWRMNPGRMEAEVIRDGLLFTSGVLDPTMGGQELENEQAMTTRRRSVYYSCHPEAGGKSEFGALFDAPDAGECYRRTRSVVPQQALALTNAPLIHDLADTLASTLWERAAGADRDLAFLNTIYEQILSRRPTSEERDLCLAYLSRHADRARARAGLVRALYNHHDFLTIR
ncbi:MAG: DUF1553 domain-containing protein, partial [Isosphaeraceae bacterium]